MELKSEFDVASGPSSSDFEVGSIVNESWLQRYARLLSVETGGIERVTEEARQHNTTQVWNACTFW